MPEVNVNDWQGKRVLVTGSAGFIGSHLAERLVQEGAAVRAFVRYGSRGSAGWLDDSPVRADLEIIAGDIRDAEQVHAAVRGIDVVYHLSSLIGIPFSYLAPRSYVETNVGGALNVLQAARSVGVERLIHTSTSEVYGTAIYTPQDEKHPIQTQSPYSSSKAAADGFALSFHRSFEVPITIVRPFNVFGPRQSTRAIIPTIIAQLLAGPVVHLGSVHPIRDLNYVANTVDGFLLAGLSDAAVGRTINIGSGEGVSIGDLAQRIARLMDRYVTIVTDPQRVRPANSEVDRLVCDASLARSLLGWAPAVSLDEGLRRTIEWTREHADVRKAASYAI